MGTVTFLKSTLCDPLTVSVRSQEQRTLLSLLTQLELFQEGACGKGRCGNCAVKISPRRLTSASRQARLSEHEKLVLFNSGKLTREQYEAETILETPSLWRLACQYVVRYEEIWVAV